MRCSNQTASGRGAAELAAAAATTAALEHSYVSQQKQQPLHPPAVVPLRALGPFRSIHTGIGLGCIRAGEGTFPVLASEHRAHPRSSAVRDGARVLYDLSTTIPSCDTEFCEKA